MSFVNPALLFGTLLFAVPLIIHLLNRQRYKRREWAAMEFLLLAFKKQRRRLRTENLLLLLLRCLIPILLAIAIARPVLRQSLGAATLGTSAHHVLILDHSYSMGYQPESSQSPYQRMRELAGQLLETLESSNDNKVTIVEAGIHTRMPIVEDLNLGRVKAHVASLTGPEDSASDLTEALGQVADLIEGGTEQEVVVYLFTDLQVRAFGEAPEAARAADPGAPPADPDALPPDPDQLFDDTARDLIERLTKTSEVVVLDVGGLANDASPARAGNVQITDLQLRTMVAVARDPVSVAVTLRNRSDAATTVQVTLEKDGGQPERQSVRVEAGAEAEAEFLVTFRNEGLSTLRASIDGDGLAADNLRFLVVPVRSRINVLIVEGTAEAEPDLQESDYVRALLDPTRGEGSTALTVVQPKVIDTIAFLQCREDLADYDLVILANVDQLNDAAASAIKEAMLGGTGLWVMMGDNTNAASYNLHLGGADGPMPMLLSGPEGYEPGGERYYEPVLLQPDHPVFSGFVEEFYKEAFQLTPIYRYIDTSTADIDDGQVLAAVRDDDLSPLMVISTHGTGKALFMTSGITLRPKRWNRLDELMLALPLVYETARWLALPVTDPYNVTTGAELSTTLRERPADVAVVMPERAGGAKVLVAEDSRSLPGGRFALPPFHRTEYAGIYTMEMELASRPHRELFAANVDPSEGDLSYLSHATASEQLGIESILRTLPSDTAGPIHSGRSDLGVPLLYLALIVLLSEASLARFVSRRRAT